MANKDADLLSTRKVKVFSSQSILAASQSLSDVSLNSNRHERSYGSPQKSFVPFVKEAILIQRHIRFTSHFCHFTSLISIPPQIRSAFPHKMQKLNKCANETEKSQSHLRLGLHFHHDVKILRNIHIPTHVSIPPQIRSAFPLNPMLSILLYASSRLNPTIDQVFISTKQLKRSP